MMGLLGRGGPAPRWRARSLEAGLLRLRAQHARTSACGEVGWWWISLLPGAPCAMLARSGRGRHARCRQERRAPPSRTPPRSRTSRFYRALCARTTGHGARARCSSRPRDRQFRRPRRSSRISGAVRSTQNSRDFRRETPSIRLCPCVDKTTHAQAESHRRLELRPGHRGREGHRRLGNMDGPGHRGRGRLLASNSLLLVDTNSREKNPAPGLAGDCRPPPAIPMANGGHPNRRPTSRPHRRRAGTGESDGSPT